MFSADDIKRIEESLTLAVGYMGRWQEDNGRYVYATDAVTKEAVKTQEYGNTRHIGTLYSLERYKRLIGDQSVETTIERGMAYVKAQMLRDVQFPSGVTGLGVVAERSNVVTLNGTALLACYLGEVVSQTADVEASDVLRRLLLTVTEMQRGDGLFFGSYDPDLRMFSRPWDVCASGEACLALTYGITCFGKQPWLSMVLSGLSCLINIRPVYVARPVVESFWWSWAALTVGRLYPFTLEPVPDGQRKFVLSPTFYYHLFNVCEQAMTANDEVPFHDQMNMSVACSNLTTMWSVYNLLTKTDDDAREWSNRSCFLPSKLKRWGRVGLLLVCDAQVKDGPLAGGVPFVKDGSTKVRVDTLSHFLDAVLGAKEVIYGENQGIV